MCILAELHVETDLHHMPQLAPKVFFAYTVKIVYFYTDKALRKSWLQTENFRNPYEGSVQLVLEIHPQETATDGLRRSNMVAINGNLNSRNKLLTVVQTLISDKLFLANNVTVI